MTTKRKIKTFIKKIGQRLYRAIFSVDIDNQFINKNFTNSLMSFFRVDEFGSRANVSKSDLGYGWIHHGFIKTMKPKNILCIGSRHGYTPAILAQSCKENGCGFVDFVDPGYDINDADHWTGVGYWRTIQGKNCFKNFGLGKWVKLHQMTSKEFYKNNNKMYDYVYIDGNHSLEGVTYDYENCWKILNKSGMIVFHDICVKGLFPEGEYGVHKLWKKITSNGEGVEFNFHGSGLGIIQKK